MNYLTHLLNQARFLLGVIIVIILFSGCAQSIFFKSYGTSTANEIGCSVVQAQNKDILIASHTGVTGNSNTVLTRLDKNGNIIWNKAISSILGIPSAIIETSNGRIMVVGSSMSSTIGADFFVLMADANGNLLWVKYYNHLLGFQFSGKSILEATPNKFIVVGSVLVNNASNRSAFVAEIDALGNPQWAKYYPVGPNMDANEIRKHPNGGYIVVGESMLDNDAFLMHVDATGTVIWYKNYTITGGLSGLGLQINNNEIAVSGHAGIVGSDPFLLVTDLNGDFKWAKQYQMNSNQDDCTLSLTYDGEYLIQGITMSGIFATKQLFLLKINATGNPVWCKQFTGSYHNISANFSTGHAQVTPARLYDNGIALVSGLKKNTSNDYDLCLIRTDVDGRIPCQQSNLIPTPVNLLENKNDYPVVGITFPLNPNNVNNPLTSMQLATNTACAQINCVRPPDGLVAWYPFNNPLYDAVGTSHPVAGSGTNTVYVLRENSLALKFNGTSDHYICPTSAPLDFGTGDFSIDFWIKIDNSSAGVMTVVDKSDTKGFTLNINNGIPELIMKDGSVGVFNSAINIADNMWHFVAVSVSRNNPWGGSWFIDGALSGVFDPTVQDHTISSTSAMYIGRRILSSPQWLKGELDELELFNTTLDFSKVQELYFSKVEGKCTNIAHAPDFAGLCAADSYVDISFSLCNYGPAPRVYTLQNIEGLPANLLGCDVDGPTNYTLLSSGAVTVQQGDCGLISVRLQKPAGLNNPFDKACYQATFIDDQGNTFWIEAGMLLYNCLIVTSEGNTKENSAVRTGICQLTNNIPLKLTAQLSSDSQQAKELKYRISVKNASGEALTNGSFTINGKPFVEGKVKTSAETPASIPFEVQLNACFPLSFIQVVIEIEDNGLLKPVSTIGFICKRRE